MSDPIYVVIGDDPIEVVIAEEPINVFTAEEPINVSIAEVPVNVTVQEESINVTLEGVTGGGTVDIDPTNYLGSNAVPTSPSPTKNRTLVVGGTPKLVMVERGLLRPTDDYTVSGNTVTFLTYLSDAMRITIWT